MHRVYCTAETAQIYSLKSIFKIRSILRDMGGGTNPFPGVFRPLDLTKFPNIEKFNCFSKFEFRFVLKNEYLRVPV